MALAAPAFRVVPTEMRIIIPVVFNQFASRPTTVHVCTCGARINRHINAADARYFPTRSQLHNQSNTADQYAKLPETTVYYKKTHTHTKRSQRFCVHCIYVDNIIKYL